MRLERVLFRATFAASIVSATVLIWSHRFLPISDYPDCVFEGSIAAELLRGKAPPSYSFKHYPVPYSATVSMLGILDLVFSPEVSGKIVLTFCVILLALSSTYLLRSLKPKANSPLLFVPLLFLLNTFFFWGELNYLFGLSVLFFYCGYLFRRVYGTATIDWRLVFLLATLAFFCHFIPFAIAVMVTAILIAVERRGELVRPFAIAFAPSFVLTIWYALERLAMPAAGPIWQFWSLHQFAGRAIAAFSPFPEFLPWIGINSWGMTVFALLNLVITALMIGLVPVVVVVFAADRTANRGVLACAIACALAVAFSGYEFAGMLSPGERFLYPALWIGLCWLIGSISRDDPILNRGLSVVFLSLIAVQILFLQVAVGSASVQLSSLYLKLRESSSKADFCETYETYVRKSWDAPNRAGLDVLLTNHASAPRLPYYIFVENKSEAPIFRIGVLNYSGKGDNEDLCRSQ